MANARGKAIDNTHLSIDTAEERGFIHRDYLAHCLRWSHVVKCLYKNSSWIDATILDIGCGREIPLMKLLYSNKMLPMNYIGVDVNELSLPEMLQRDRPEKVVHLYGKTDAAYDIGLCGERMVMRTHDEGSYDRPNVITCFEVLEHVEPQHSVDLLKMIHYIMPDHGTAFISTPCFNGSAAGNHVNEITYEALGRVILDLGFGIEGIYGTFASQRDIESKLGDCKEYWELKRYYDSNVLSILMAPLYPELSRNALWVLRKYPISGKEYQFPEWDQLETPWTSSKLWEELRSTHEGN